MVPGIIKNQAYQPDPLFKGGVKETKTPKMSVEHLEEQEATGYVIREEPLHTRRPFRTICLGGGYA